MRIGRREGVGPAAAAHAECRKAPTVEAEGRARVKRTLNMDCIVVTLDVSKLSGWLNENASCGVERSTRGMRCGPGRGRAWGSRGGASSVQEGPDCED